MLPRSFLAIHHLLNCGGCGLREGSLALDKSEAASFLDDHIQRVLGVGCHIFVNCLAVNLGISYIFNPLAAFGFVELVAQDRGTARGGWGCVTEQVKITLASSANRQRKHLSQVHSATTSKASSLLQLANRGSPSTTRNKAHMPQVQGAVLADSITGDKQMATDYSDLKPAEIGVAAPAAEDEIHSRHSSYTKSKPTVDTKQQVRTFSSR